jgi:hypothetical protein
MNRIEVTTDDKSGKTATIQPSAINSRHLLQSAVTPDDACSLFGQGYESLFWDTENSQPRQFPDGDCGQQGLGLLYGQGPASQDMLKKLCSLSGPATDSSCGESGFLGYLNKFASPLMGLVTDECRLFFAACIIDLNSMTLDVLRQCQHHNENLFVIYNFDR